MSLFNWMPERNFASWNAMISGYEDKGNVASARKIFCVCPEKSVSWITMSDGYSKCGDVAAAHELFWVIRICLCLML